MQVTAEILLPVIGALVGTLIATFVVMIQSRQTAAIGFGVKQSKILMPLNLKKSMLLTLSSSLILILAGLSYFAVNAYIEAHKPVVEAPMVKITYSQLGAPPSLTGSDVAQEKISATAPGAAPTQGVPKPVPDEQAGDEDAATQSQMGAMSAGLATTGEATATGATVGEEEAYAGKGEFKAMEKTPEIVKKVAPVYPSMAKQRGSSGKVILYLLIGTDGHVRQADIAKSSGFDDLDEAAVAAAKQFIFTPAVAPGGKTVPVWVMYPVTFSLND
ncbi:energy transducer TonB [candidate division TA06 bacterium]|nr:energy transducer TonB [candidate division TA06 bacterium]